MVQGDIEDESLLIIATEISKPDIISLIGGASYSSCLFPLLEFLLGVDETIVRDAAVTAARIVFVSPVVSLHVIL